MEVVKKIVDGNFKEVQLTWKGVFTNGKKYWYIIQVEGRRKYKRKWEEIDSYSVGCGSMASHAEIDDIAVELADHGFRVVNSFHACGHHWLILRR